MATGYTLESGSSPSGRRRLRLEGSLTLADGHLLWRDVSRALAGDGAETQVETEVDCAGITRIDGGSAALLAALFAAARARGCAVELVGASRQTARMLDLYDCKGGVPCGRPSPRHPGLIAEVGNFAYYGVTATRAILDFIGDLVAGLYAAVRRPRSVHVGDLGGLVERAGADGVPIVLLINFLVGAILGLQGAIQLHRFGGDQFLANLVGLSVVRELGPLMTAILITGRSGAAYAAELGTMTVNEEIDALRTLGQDPQRFLVFPRVLTLVLVVPVLTVLGDLIGCLGGLAVAVTYLDQPPIVYVQSLQGAVGFADVGTGLLKSLGFAFAIGLISCQRGLSTRGGAVGVGRATTSAVVVTLFMLVVIDAVFTWLFTLLDW